METRKITWKQTLVIRLQSLFGFLHALIYVHVCVHMLLCHLIPCNNDHRGNFSCNSVIYIATLRPCPISVFLSPYMVTNKILYESHTIHSFQTAFFFIKYNHLTFYSDCCTLSIVCSFLLLNKISLNRYTSLINHSLFENQLGCF